MEEKKLYSTSRAAQILDVSTNTVIRWYKWYENDKYEKPVDLILPEYTTDNRGTKFFTIEAIQALQGLKDKLQGEYKGCMADFNAYWQWGKRGKEMLEKRKEKRCENE